MHGVAPTKAEGPARRASAEGRAEWTRRVVATFWQISAKFRSLSAVSAPIFASKNAFFSIFHNLQDCLAEIFEIRQNFADFATLAKMLQNFHENC